MILRRIRLKNVRSYETADLTLSQGITALWGDIGSGKSSLLFAVEAALFGFADVDWGHLLRQGESTARVEVEFEDDGASLVVQREFVRARSGEKESAPTQRCTLVRDGSQTTYGVTEMKGRVTELLGFPESPNPRRSSEVWRWAIYVRQESMREILSEEGDRKEIIRKAHGLEEYRVARENVPVVQSELRRRAEEHRRLAERLSTESSGLEEDLAKVQELGARVPQVEARIAQLAAEIQEASAQLLRGQSVQAEARLAGQKRESLKEHHSSLTSAVQDGERRSGDLTKEISSREAECLRIDTELSKVPPSPGNRPELEALLKKHRGEVSSLEVQRTNLLNQRVRWEETTRSLTELRGRKEGRIRESEQLESEVRSLELRWKEPPALPSGSADRTTIETRRTLAQKEIHQLATQKGGAEHREADLRLLLESGKCPRCGQHVDVDSFTSHLDDATHERERIEAEIRSLEIQRSEAESALDLLGKYEIARTEWEHGRERVQERTARLSALRSEVQGMEDREASLRTTLVELEAEMGKLAPLETSLSDARAQETRTAQSLEELRTIEERRGRLEGLRAVAGERAQQSRERLDVLSTELRTRKEEAAHLLSEIATLDEQIVRLEKETLGFHGVAERVEGLRASHLQSALEKKELEKELDMRSRERERKEDARRSMAQETEASLRQLAQVEWLKSFARACEEIERARFDRIRSEFLAAFSHGFSILVDDDTMTATVDADFRPLVTVNGHSLPAASLSGGERTALALAYRLALRESVLSAQHIRLDTLVLDEPTDGFSAEQVAKLAELLRDLKTRQVILVSHERNLAGVAHQTVHVVKRDGQSTIEAPATPSPDLRAPETAPVSKVPDMVQTQLK